MRRKIKTVGRRKKQNKPIKKERKKERKKWMIKIQKIISE